MCIRDVLVVYWWYIRLLCWRLCLGLSAELNLSAGWASPWRDVSSVMYVACIANVSGMYHGCITMVISLYLSCIMDVLVVVPHTSVFLHTLPIKFLGPSLSGHPDLPMGLASVGWREPLHGSTRHAFWQTGHACSSIPCWVLYCRNYCWSGIHTVQLHSMLQAWDTGLLWGAKQGPKNSEK